MCGIAGIVRRDPREAVDEARLKGMRDVLRHRGPDGEGLLLDGPVGLGHRRLAIIDVAGGQQPMANEDGTIWIVYNGEIYNHAALRPGLEARGHRYRTRSDTETVLHAYEEDGERCVERLQGMFAFALWDRPRGRLLLARDRLGIKPLYYAVTRDELLFASEIKAILAALPGRPVFNRRVVPEFLATRFVSGQETFFEGIHKLLRARLSANHPEQYAIRPALQGRQEHLQEMLFKLRSRRDLTMKFCKETPRLSCVNPQGAFYAFPRLEIEGSDEDFVRQLLLEKRVLAVHGSGFGQASGTRHFRIVFLPDEETLSQAYESIGAFLREHYR